MKTKFKTLLFFVLCFQFSFAQTNDPVVITINNKPITKSEFEYTFNKNNSENAIDKKTLDEYVDMFVDYKLKVEEAKALGLDTIKSFVSEYNSYKSQLAQPYLENDEVKTKLAREAYERKKTETEVSHILLNLPRQYYPKDTVAVYNKIMEIRDKIVNGGQDFNAMAAEYSEDPSARRTRDPKTAGYIGWTTALRMVDDFEHGMYATKTGEVSYPVRSRFGYHLIKVHNRRPSQGDVKVAHIMFAIAPTMTETQKDSVKNIANDVYKQLKAGADFAELTKKYSSDINTKDTGGELSWFTSGQYPKSFDETAFGLKNKGDFAAPIETNYGYHIIKLIDKRDMLSFEDTKESLFNAFARGFRMSETRNGEVERIKKLVKFTENAETYQKMASIADTLFAGDPKFHEIYPNKEDMLFTINNKEYKVSDFFEYLKFDKYPMTSLSTEDLFDKYNKYLLNQLKEGEMQSLADNNPEFKNLSQEYYDGILLFELMNREVWNRAQNDNVGLENYFAKNQKNYKWNQPKFAGAVILAANTQIKNKIEELTSLPIDSLYTRLEELQKEDTNFKIKVEKGTWAKGENSFVDFKAFNGDIYPATENAYPHYFVVGEIQSQPKLDDIRGEVMNDYQNYLEQTMMQRLRKKFPVKVNKSALKHLK